MKTTTFVYGTENSWSLKSKSPNVAKTKCEMNLEIQGNKKHGYNLIMSPQGFFAADNWYKTKEEALEEAQDMFGILPEQWFTEKTQRN